MLKRCTPQDLAILVAKWRTTFFTIWWCKLVVNLCCEMTTDNLELANLFFFFLFEWSLTINNSCKAMTFTGYVSITYFYCPQDLEQIACRSDHNEVKLILLRLVSVLLSRSRSGSKYSSEVRTQLSPQVIQLQRFKIHYHYSVPYQTCSGKDFFA